MINLLGNKKNIPAKQLEQKIWNNSLKVMNERKMFIFEELAQGIVFLSVKAPLIINNKVEGIIGLAVNINDKKKAEQLEQINKINANLYMLARQVAHDLISPVSAMKVIIESLLPNLQKNKKSLLKDSMQNIENITHTLLQNYNFKFINDKTDSFLSVFLELDAIVVSKKYQYMNYNLNINFYPDQNNNFVYIHGNPLYFSRMISNLIDNSVYATKSRLFKQTSLC
jgi:signal transduction histidine kinase